MDYLPHIGRMVDLFLCLVLATLAGLNVYFRHPESGLLVVTFVGCTLVWVIANYICLAWMITHRREAA